MTHLDLTGFVFVGDEAILNLASATSLQMLSLSGTKLTDIGSSVLVHMLSLRELALDRTDIGDKSMEYIRGAIFLFFLVAGCCDYHSAIIDNALFVHFARSWQDRGALIEPMPPLDYSRGVDAWKELLLQAATEAPEPRIQPVHPRRGAHGLYGLQWAHHSESGAHRRVRAKGAAAPAYVSFLCYYAFAFLWLVARTTLLNVDRTFLSFLSS